MPTNTDSIVELRVQFDNAGKSCSTSPEEELTHDKLIRLTNRTIGGSAG